MTRQEREEKARVERYKELSTTELLELYLRAEIRLNQLRGEFLAYVRVLRERPVPSGPLATAYAQDDRDPEWCRRRDAYCEATEDAQALYRVLVVHRGHPWPLPKIEVSPDGDRARYKTEEVKPNGGWCADRVGQCSPEWVSLDDVRGAGAQMASCGGQHTQSPQQECRELAGQAA